MSDKDKTKEQLIKEAAEMRRKISGLESALRDQAAAKKTLEKYRLLLSRINDLVYICDDKGNILFVNDAFEELAGYKPEEFIGKPFGPLFDEKNLEKAMDIYSRTLAGESPQMEIAFKGSEITCEYKNIPLRNEKGKVDGVLGIARDITQRKKSERELERAREELEEKVSERTSELESAVRLLREEIAERKKVERELKEKSAQLYTVIENLPFDVFGLDRDGKYFIQNSASREKWGDIIGCSPEDLAPDKATLALWQENNRRVMSGKVINEETSFSLPDGKTRDFHNIITPIRDGKEVRGVLGINIDITEQKRAEKKLADSENTYRHIVENATVGIARTNAQGEILYVNATIARMLGYDSIQELMLENAVARYADPADREAVLKAVREEGRIDNYELNLKTKTGKVKNFIISAFLEDDIFTAIFVDNSERKAAENELRESEAMLKQAESIGKIGGWVWNIEKDHVAWSDNLCMIHGIAPGKFDGKLETAMSFIHPDDIMYVKERVQLLFEEKKSLTFEYRIIAKDGTEKTLNGRQQFVFDENGNIAQMVGMLRDITEQKRAEEQFKRQQYYLERAQEIGAIGTWELDILNNKLIWTDQNYRNFGLPQDTPLNYEAFLDCVHPDDREYVNTEWIAAIGGRPYDIEHRIIVNGTVRWVREKADVSFDEEGDGVYAIGFTQDITEKKKAEEALKESKENWRSLTTSSPDHIVTLDTDLNIRFANYASPGLSVDELIGSPIYKYVPEEKQDEIRGILETVLQTHRRVNYETAYLAPDGREIYYESRVAPRIVGGRVVGLTVSARDITERKLMEEEILKHRDRLNDLVKERTAELEEANEMLVMEINERMRAEAGAVQSSHMAALGELASGVAHEINNPINGIINYAQMLYNRFTEDGKDQEITGRIIKEGDRVARIVHTLLSVAREGKAQKSPVRINDIIANTISLNKTQLAKDGIMLKVDVPLDLPPVFVHKKQMVVVFLNIISNARYALNHKSMSTSEKKVIEITGIKKDIEGSQYIRLVFYDNGDGIPRNIMDRIMNPFFSTKPSREGTGLGLSISHSIINDHGGRILVDSIEGDYTKIMVDLPQL